MLLKLQLPAPEHTHLYAQIPGYLATLTRLLSQLYGFFFEFLGIRCLPGRHDGKLVDKTIYSFSFNRPCLRGKPTLGFTPKNEPLETNRPQTDKTSKLTFHTQRVG